MIRKQTLQNFQLVTAEYEQLKRELRAQFPAAFSDLPDDALAPEDRAARQVIRKFEALLQVGQDHLMADEVEGDGKVQ